MKLPCLIVVCVINVMAQTYYYNIYENVFIDERDGNTYNIFETDSSKWIIEDLRYIPKINTLENVINGELYCESDLKLDRIAIDENSSLFFERIRTLIEGCRRVYYKWNIAMVSCPSGWHLARTEEWIELSSFLDKYPFLKNVFFSDYPNYVNYYTRGKREYVTYENLSKWWHANLDSKSKKNTRARVTSSKNRMMDVDRYGRKSVFWTSNITKSWSLLPARCVENKKGVDYSVSIPPIDSSSSKIFGHGLKNKSNDVSELRLDQLM